VAGSRFEPGISRIRSRTQAITTLVQSLLSMNSAVSTNTDNSNRNSVILAYAHGALERVVMGMYARWQ
jgi:hypothetical protein